MPAPIKRSIKIGGHRTSVSLEEPFWEALAEIAASKGQSVPQLIEGIDRGRRDGSLSSAIRIYALAHFRRPG
jgi:predicted DNA-binding ribbon-helix-helix protein